jgi:hypothetical protein
VKWSAVTLDASNTSPVPVPDLLGIRDCCAKISLNEKYNSGIGLGNDHLIHAIFSFG